MKEVPKTEIDIRDELFGLDDKKEWLGIRNFTFTKLIFLISLIMGFGLYIGNLLFGVDSLSVLEELSKKEQILQLNIEKLKEENAKLQKDYFELKGLEPE